MPKKEKTYEEELERFEEIIDLLNSGNISLSESISLFKEGEILSKSLKKRLDDFNGEILKLNSDNDSFDKVDIKITDNEQ